MIRLQNSGSLRNQLFKSKESCINMLSDVYLRAKCFLGNVKTFVHDVVFVLRDFPVYLQSWSMSVKNLASVNAWRGAAWKISLAEGTGLLGQVTVGR